MFKFFKNKIITLLYYIIENIEKYEYRNLNIDEDDIDKKIINSISNLNIKVKSDTGFVPASSIHITQPYKVYKIKTTDYYLECADIHILFDSNYNEVYCKDIKIGDYIQTISGKQQVISIDSSNRKVSMFDLSIDDKNHRYYTNGILSHNTISAAITMLHFITFNNDKNIMIVANIANTAIEIIDKIKAIYMLLPFFMKVGIKNWNQRTMIFGNGCRIKSSARTKTPAIGFTIDFLYMDEFAHIPPNIINAYYTAAFPTVSAIENSKIIITSTPNGMNLFWKLLTEAERPDGDPMKNNYRAMRVYWYQVPGRFVTYYRLNNHKMNELGITKEDVLEQVNEEFGDRTKIELKYYSDNMKDVILVYNNEFCTDEMAKSFQFITKEGLQVNIRSLAEVTTWKEEAIKDIGGEDAFNQEYGLRFINSSRSLLNEATIESLLNNKRNYVHEQIYEFDKKLKFSYSDLKWIDDDSIFMPIQRKTVRGVISVDISEGLGQDYSVINIFKIAPKPMEVINMQKNSYSNMSDFFCLVQIAMFRSNLVSVKQLAELFYLIGFEYFNYENFKVVLEINTYGNEFLAHLPHVFDGNNNYGSSIFFRYKHRADASEDKVGLKVGENKNMLVKEYQDAMDKKKFVITNEDNVREITTFVKHTTSAGNTRYAADIGNDDCLLPGTLIKTNLGYKKIEDIKLGDMVLTHLGNFKPVTNICIKDFSGDMYRMKFAGQLELNLTYNHPMYFAELDTKSHNYKSGKKIFNTRKWILPGDVNSGLNQISIIDRLENKDITTLQHDDIFVKSKFTPDSNIKLKSIELNADFSRFLGLFLADGNCYKPKSDVYRLSIAFNRKQVDLIDWVKQYLTSIGVKFYDRFYDNSNSFELIFNNKTLYELLILCYDNKREKILPEFALLLGDNLQYLLEYWLKGDGWVSKRKNNRKEKNIGCSTSRQLALSMRDIAMSIGKYATIDKKNRKRYEVINKDQYWVSIYDERPSSGCLYKFNSMEYGSKIRKIEKYNYIGKTYNLEVMDDNSYIAEGMVVHNCVMSLVDASSVFNRYDYRQMCEDYANTVLDKETLAQFNTILKQVEYKESTDYSTIINVNRQRRLIKNQSTGNNWFEIK